MWTTSRYCSPETRSLCKKLASQLGSSYVARGKKTIAQLAAFARRKGDSSIHVLEEKSGKPVTVAILEVLETGQWRWSNEKPVDEYEIRRKAKRGI